MGRRSRYPPGKSNPKASRTLLHKKRASPAAESGSQNNWRRVIQLSLPDISPRETPLIWQRLSVDSKKSSHQSFSRKNSWHGDCKQLLLICYLWVQIKLARGGQGELLFHTKPRGELAMSPKQQRKFRGIRRVNRRPRGWARWFRDGFLDMEPRGSMRLRLALNSPRGT